MSGAANGITAALCALACSTSGLVNCEQVTSRPEAMLGPVPLALLGVAWFGVFLGLLGLRAPPLPRLVWSGLGLVVGLLLLAVAESAADQPASMRQGVGRQPGRS